MQSALLTLEALAFIAVMGFVDASTGADLAFSVFYLLPVIGTAWYVGRNQAMLTAVAAAVVWVAAEYANRPGIEVAIHLWNGLTRLAIFVALGVLTTLLVRERAALRTVDRQREEALNFVAQELRGSVAAIEKDIPPLLAVQALEPEHRLTLLALRRRAHGLKRFAEDVLAVGRLEQGALELHPAVLDVGDLVARAARESIDPDRVSLLLPSEPVPVEVDPERFLHAVEHLVSNALKYSPPSSGVFIRVATADGTARIDVRDDGVGFAEAERPLLFQKYGRARNTRTAQVLGVGLGLYVTRLLVEAHGGTLAAKSVGPGFGSTFTISLPIASTSHREAARSAAEAGARG